MNGFIVEITQENHHLETRDLIINCLVLYKAIKEIELHNCVSAGKSKMIVIVQQQVLPLVMVIKHFLFILFVVVYFIFCFIIEVIKISIRFRNSSIGRVASLDMIHYTPYHLDQDDVFIRKYNLTKYLLNFESVKVKPTLSHQRIELKF